MLGFSREIFRANTKVYIKIYKRYLLEELVPGTVEAGVSCGRPSASLETKDAGSIVQSKSDSLITFSQKLKTP